MRTKVALVGDSTALTFAAKALSDQVGTHTHIQLQLFCRDVELLWPHTISVFGKISTISKHLLLPNVEVITDEVKGVSVSQRRIVTAGDIYEFDRLIIDEGECLTAIDYRTIREQITNIFAAARASKKAAHIQVQGPGVQLDQLAVAILRDAKSHRVHDLKVVRDTSGNSNISEFLSEIGVLTKKPSTPALVIKPTLSAVSLRKIKGISLGNKLSVYCDTYWRSVTNTNVVVVPRKFTESVNMLLPARSVANVLAKNLLISIGEMPGEKLKKVDYIEAFILDSGVKRLVCLGSIKSSLVRAKIIQLAESAMWKSTKQKAN